MKEFRLRETKTGEVEMLVSKNQKNNTKVEVTFVVESPDLDLNELTRKMEIKPTKVRTKNDWPDVIKKGVGIPKEYQARCVWEFAEYEYACIEIENVLNKVKRKIEGKQQIIQDVQKQYDAETAVVVDIYCQEMSMPALVLSAEAITFLNSIKAELSFNICIL